METRKGCRSNSHHLYYPKRNYKTPLEREFRELPENKEQMCMYLHQLLHETEWPPKKPKPEEMIRAIGESAIEEAV